MNIDKIDGGLPSAPRSGPSPAGSSSRGVAQKAQSGEPSAELTLSDVAQSLKPQSAGSSAGQVDRQRVEQIRAAIADGTYHIDTTRLAERFLELESALDQ